MHLKHLKTHERLKILSLLEDGKISAQEAENLLKALGTDSHFIEHNYYDSERLSKISENLDSFSKDVGAKTKDALKGMEPTFKKAKKAVFEKTAKMTDNISKMLNKNLEKMEHQEENNDSKPKTEHEETIDSAHDRDNKTSVAPTGNTYNLKNINEAFKKNNEDSLKTQTNAIKPDPQINNTTTKNNN